MNQICFTKDFQYALNASMNPNFRVVLITEHAPLPLQQNANIVRLPNLLPPYSVVSEYVDRGEDAFIERDNHEYLSFRKCIIDKKYYNLYN